MFGKNVQRYATNGVMNEIPGYLQTMMWYMIETMEVDQDYLQIFELKRELVDGKLKQKLIHSQEQPPYKKEMIFEAANPTTNKVYIIDDKTHVTMLLSEEY